MIHYRKLNDKNVRDKYSLLNITNLLDKLERCTILSPEFPSNSYQRKLLTKILLLTPKTLTIRIKK